MIENTIQELKKSIDQLTVAIEALLESQRTASVRSAAVDQPAEEPTPKPKKTKAPKVEEPAPAPAPAPVAEPAAPAPAPTEQTYTVQDLRAEAQKALESGKAMEVVALNKEYGVKRISEVSPDLYPVIIKRLRAING
jgi:cell division septation protein DedD